jgi:hypothetical protein
MNEALRYIELAIEALPRTHPAPREHLGRDVVRVKLGPV